MSRAELIELNETKKLLEEHQPILESREKGLNAELANKMPELEHAIISLVYAYNNSKKRADEILKIYGPNLIKKTVPSPTLNVSMGEEIKLVTSPPDYSTTLTDVDVDTMVKEFRELLSAVLNIVNHQKDIKSIMEELNDVRRKNNAIKHAIIPELLENMKELNDKLEQEEIDEKIRLMFFEL